MDYFISLELEKAITTGLLIHLIFSSILHCAAFYCLVRETPSHQQAIRKYLLSIQVITFLFDLTMDLLIEPVPLLPIPAAYLKGILSRAGVPLAVLLATFVCLGAMMMSAIDLCFLHKHQTLIDNSSIFKLNKLSYNLVYLVYFSTCVGSFTVISLWPLDRTSSDAAMETYSINLTWIKERGDYVVMEKSPMTKLASYIFLAVGQYSGKLNRYQCTRLAHIPHAQQSGSFPVVVEALSIKSRRSAATQEKIKRSVVALCIQLFVPSIFLGAPLFVDFISLATDSGNFTTCFILFFTLPLHSPVHSILVILITPSYRRAILLLFNCHPKGSENSLAFNTIVAVSPIRRT